jgi:hypothetical protein
VESSEKVGGRRWEEIHTTSRNTKSSADIMGERGGVLIYGRQRDIQRRGKRKGSGWCRCRDGRGMMIWRCFCGESGKVSFSLSAVQPQFYHRKYCSLSNPTVRESVHTVLLIAYRTCAHTRFSPTAHAGTIEQWDGLLQQKEDSHPTERADGRSGKVRCSRRDGNYGILYCTYSNLYRVVFFPSSPTLSRPRSPSPFLFLFPHSLPLLARSFTTYSSYLLLVPPSLPPGSLPCAAGSTESKPLKSLLWNALAAMIRCS